MEITDYSDREKTGSLGSKVFSRLENDILEGKYRPGESLKELKLSYEMGVSRTPVREAIRQLELEGLVRIIPNKGAVVKGLSKEDIKDICTVRTLVEGLASKRAAQNVTDEELMELEEIVQLEEFYTGRNDTDRLIKLDSRFHEILFRASKSLPLNHMLGTFHHYLQKARTASFKIPGRAKMVLEEHKAVLEAIRCRDGEKAERLTTDHVRNASINLIEQ